MPSLASIVNRVFLHQTVAIWTKTGSDGFGKPVYSDPVDVKCRYEEKLQEIITSDSRKVFSRGYLLLITPIAVGSLVLVASVPGASAIDQWKALPTYPALPTKNQGGLEVVLLHKSPDLKAKSNIYEAYL